MVIRHSNLRTLKADRLMKIYLHINRFLLIDAALLMLAACGGGSSNSASSESNRHADNSDGYYNGQYSFRRGMEWGEMEIKGDVWVAQGAQESWNGGVEQFGYSGSIRGEELVVNTTMFGANVTGCVFAEFDGRNISSGGWTYKRN